MEDDVGARSVKNGLYVSIVRLMVGVVRVWWTKESGWELSRVRKKVELGCPCCGSSLPNSFVADLPRINTRPPSRYPIYLFMLLAIRNLITNITAAFGMSENAPPGPGGAPATVNTSADVSRGVPYYEKIRRDLKDTIQKKRILDQNLVHLSVQRILAEKLELTM